MRFIICFLKFLVSSQILVSLGEICLLILSLAFCVSPSSVHVRELPLASLGVRNWLWERSLHTVCARWLLTSQVIK